MRIGFVGLTRTANILALGLTAGISSSRFGPAYTFSDVIAVILPSGWLRPATSRAATGSAPIARITEMSSSSLSTLYQADATLTWAELSPAGSHQLWAGALIRLPRRHWRELWKAQQGPVLSRF